MLHWRWSARSRHLASTLFFGRFCIRSGLNAFVQDTLPYMFLPIQPTFLVGCLGTWIFRVSSEPGPMYMKYQALNFSEVSSIYFRILQNLRTTSFRSLWTKRNFVHRSHEDNLMRASFWSKKLCIFSSALSNPLIDVEHYVVRFATKKYLESELDWFSTILLVDYMHYQMLIPTSCWTWFLASS